MITLAPIVKNINKYGYGKVYIRVTKERQHRFISLDYVVSSDQVKKGVVTDYMAIADIAPTIQSYYNRLNKTDTSGWDIDEVVSLLKNNKSEVSFTDFYDKFLSKMYNDDRDNAADNYISALNSLKKFIGKDNINFSDITSKLITSWIDGMKKTKRAKNQYPMLIKNVFNAGLIEFNDYDRDIIRIKNQPFMAVKIPKAEIPQKRAVKKEILLKLFNADLSKCKKIAKAPLGKDVAKIIFYLAGINAADLYFMLKGSYKNGKLIYSRHKTKMVRDDKARFEISVPGIIEPLFEKYIGKEYLFNFAETYSTSDDFTRSINKGLKEICEIYDIEKVTTYTLRHSWATIAQNECGASTELVSFCLNHASAHKVTEGYIKKDFSPVDQLNDKVIKLMLFTGSESNDTT